MSLFNGYHNFFLEAKMGGVQARAGSVAEVHAVRGGQLILRVSPSQTSKQLNTGNKRSRRQSKTKCLTLLGVIGNSWEEVEKVAQAQVDAINALYKEEGVTFVC